MTSTRVYLIRRSRTLPSGKATSTYYLQWAGSNGKPQFESVGRVDQVTRKAAETARRNKELAINGGKALRDKPRKLTLTEYFDQDRQAIAADVRGGTLIEYDLAISKAKAALGDEFILTSVGAAEVGRIKSWLHDPPKADTPEQQDKRKVRRPASPATISKTLRILRASFNRASRLGLVPRNPFAGVALPKSEGRIKRIFTRGEIDAMMTAAPDEWWRTFIKLAATSGLRRDELLNLQWADIDMEKAIVTVQRKAAGTAQIRQRTYQTWEWSAKATASYRAVPLPQDTIEQLKKQRIRMGASPFVFIDEKRLAVMQRHIGNGRLPAKFELIPNLLRGFAAIQRRAAQAKPWAIGCIHDLRKTYCTWMADIVPMHVLREWAGHSDISTTARFYLGVADDMAERARKALAASA